MNQIVNAFFQLSSEKFQYLVDELGFRRGPKRSEGGLYRVLYQSETTAVEIGLEWNEQYIYVELSRLIKGKIKENPIMIQRNSELTVHNLEDLIGIRAPGMMLGPEYFSRPLTVDSLDHVLTYYSRALRELGGDLLQGDFTVFRELESIVKARISPAVSVDDKAPVTRPITLSKKHSMKLSGRSQVR
jgi:hypothetical protein